MGQKFNRKKTRNYINSVIYKLSKVKFASDRVKFRLYSDLDWIFNRLAHEYSVKILDNDLHPMKKGLYDFLQDKISQADTILDLGCGYGEISCKLSERCKSVIGIESLLEKFKKYFTFIYIEVPDFESTYLNKVRELLNIHLNYSDEDHIYEFDRNEMTQIITKLDMSIVDSEFRFGVLRFWIEV